MKRTRFLSMTAAILAVLLMATTAASCSGNTGEGEETTPDTKVEVTNAPSNNTETPDGTDVPDVTETPEETEEPTQPVEETYTVKFMDGESEILAVEGKSGDLIDIPADPVSADSKRIFAGWEGMDDADYAAGKVEIFKENLTFTAKWAQQFGTENVYTATKLDSGDTITVDGDKDESYNDATAIEINTAVAGAPGATAKAYIMWDTTHYYLFIEVTDENVFTYTPGAWVEHNDGVEFRMDLLHSDAIVPGYNGGWGGSYRGEPGPMVEAGFKIGAGVALADGQRFGEGAEAYWEWWSNHIRENGDSFGISKVTETGYTVEYKLEIFDAYTDELYRPHEGQVIGFGIRIFDKTAEGGSGTDNKLVLETINDGMDGDARNLSNIKLIANPNP